jgi:hypothetical protein
MKRKIVLLPAAVFSVFIFIFTVMFIITPKSDYSSSEKRYLEDFPETNLSSVTNGEFEKGFESYLADHFPLRNMWVGLNAYCNYCIGNNGCDGVYKCSDGWLINKPITTDNRIKTNTDTIIKFSKSAGVPVTMMTAPSTGYIMADKLPAVHDEYIDDYVFGDIKKSLKKEGIGFVDIRQKFKNSTEQLYYKTDHHWTSEGAYEAYEEVCRALGVKAANRDFYDIKTYPDFYGTTYSTSGFWLTKPDEIAVWCNKNHKPGDIKLTITEGSESKAYDTLFFDNHLKEDDKYPVFIDGNHALETITNKNVRKGRLLVIKDSFAHTLAPFLADSFRKVTLVDVRYYKNSVTDLVKQGKYDRVLVMYGIDNFATDTDLAWLK